MNILTGIKIAKTAIFVDTNGYFFFGGGGCFEFKYQAHKLKKHKEYKLLGLHLHPEKNTTIV